MARTKRAAPKPALRIAKAPKTAVIDGAEYPVEVVDAGTLRRHPKNYKTHPEDQLLHIAESLRQFKFYKNVVVARDGTILAGHGVYEAATSKLGWKRIPVVRLDVEPDSPAAMKVLALDNELPRFAETDDRALSEILRQIQREDPKGLLGTGYTEESLAAFLMVTRPASEIANINEAAEYVGMPDYDGGDPQIKVIVTFATEGDRKRWVDEQRMKIVKIAGLTWSARWPPVENEDVHSLKFVSK